MGTSGRAQASFVFDIIIVNFVGAVVVFVIIIFGNRVRRSQQYIYTIYNIYSIASSHQNSSGSEQQTAITKDIQILLLALLATVRQKIKYPINLVLK